MRCIRIKFSAVGTLQIRYIPSELNHRQLHSKADAKIRLLVLSGEADRSDLPFCTALTKAAWHQYRVHIFETVGTLSFDILGIDVVDINFGVCVYACMNHSLGQGLI